MSFESKRVIELTGVSVRQLNYWDHAGVVRPSSRIGKGRGSRREYSFRDLVALKVAKGLRDEGLSLQKIRKALAYLRKNFPEVEAPLAELRFITDGAKVFVLTDDPQKGWDALSGQVVFSFMLGKVIEELRGELKELAIPKEERLVVAGRSFTVLLTPDLEEGGYVVTCREVPVNTEGDSEQEALDNAIDAIELCLEVEKELEAQKKAQA